MEIYMKVLKGNNKMDFDGGVRRKSGYVEKIPKRKTGMVELPKRKYGVAEDVPKRKNGNVYREI